MTAKRIEAVLRPASVAVVGASATPGSIGDVLCRNLREGGFRGPVFYVNPRHASIGDEPSYPDVRSLPQAVDVAIIATPPPTLPTILEHCGERGVRGAIIVSAGFREGGEEGAACERTMLQVARRYGLRLLGPNSFGVIRTDDGFNASCGAALPKPGRLALVSQSSALCAATLDWARSRHVGFSTVISTGVGDDIGSGDVLDFLARDAATDGIMLYLEGVGDARRFMSALRAAARVKPVVVMKAGRSLEGRGSLAFHTGSLVGGDDVFDAAMRRAGVLRIRDFGQLYSAASTLGAGVRMRGRRLGIVTNAGGPGQLAADRAGDRGIPVARLDDATLAQLHALLPPSTAEGNPVYVRGDASAQVYAQAAQACLQDGEVDALLAVLTPFALTDADRFATELIAVATAQRKPVFTCWMGGAAVTAARQRFAENRVPTFPTPEAAVDAIAALALFTANQEQLLQVPAPLGPTSTPDRATAQRLLDTARAAGNEWLNPADSKELLAAFGIPIVRSRPAYSADEAVQVAEAIGYPVAMKILSPDIAHKTDVGGVRLGRSDARSVHDGYENMLRDVAIARPDARLEGVLIEPMYVERHGRELMIGAVRDPVFGPAISFGLGGTMVEVIRDRAVALPPLNPYLARDLIRRTRASMALQPLRGAPAAAQEAIEDMLLRVSEIVCELPDVGAIDINPVIVTARGAVAVDARIGVMPMPQPQRLYRHMAIHPYPSALEFPLDTPDGQQAKIRAIRPEDAELERDFVHRLSEQSRFLRFMFGLQDLSPAMLSRFTQIDYDRELALIVVLRLPDGAEQQIGVARYITLPDEETCEFAIVVSDEWQGKGVARRLFQCLIDIARDRRIKVMTGITLRENTRMIDLSRSLGFTTRSDADEPELVRMTLAL
ncbi:MAG: bifunctional acetate--CoA ligase family protein/GNAT family N-acetyltransferase [Steroidobacteraceae bacterium]|nr:bifunctional acetate--CoA ligase family protein/GNAT family N-acetyltransferase [Steroidobacteraceae bacterium]